MFEFLKKVEEETRLPVVIGAVFNAVASKSIQNSTQSKMLFPLLNKCTDLFIRDVLELSEAIKIKEAEAEGDDYISRSIQNSTQSKMLFPLLNKCTDHREAKKGADEKGHANNLSKIFGEEKQKFQILQKESRRLYQTKNLHFPQLDELSQIHEIKRATQDKGLANCGIGFGRNAIGGRDGGLCRHRVTNPRDRMLSSKTSHCINYDEDAGVCPSDSALRPD
ncbi:hypothetical protein KSS87_003704 [Heliosperma pusillum]|nr:hypothetical protein KSS87_003704 [Heliosperma pusillum]